MTAKEIFFKYVFNNKLLWSIAIANAFVYLIRYGVLDWAPVYLKEAKHFTVDKSSWAYFLYEWAASRVLCCVVGFPTKCLKAAARQQASCSWF